MLAETKKISFLVSLVGIGVVIGLLISARLDFLNKANAVPVLEKTPVISTVGFEDSVINVAQALGRSVVSVSVEATEKVSFKKNRSGYSPFENSPFPEDDLNRKFFEDFFGQQFPDREFKQNGLGSGVIIDEKGFILTNDHVIKRADKITVILSDGREFKAEVKGSDPRTDLAVIKIDAENLPAAKLGDSDELKIGQWTVAIGNPFGAFLNSSEPTVTAGVVSALHRALGAGLRKESDYNDLIQTDAAINPGNSGGPLVNLKGEVVGINTAIFSTSGGYEGVGFSIPVNVAKRIIGKLIEGKKISYGWLGVTVQNLDENLAKHFGLESKNGALVAKVLNAGPAEIAGLKIGDVIVKLDDQQINNIKELINIVGKSEVGKKVSLDVIRNKKYLQSEIALGERPSIADEDDNLVEEKDSYFTWRGISVSDITPEIAKYYKLEGTKGVVVANIKPGTPAEEAGLDKGDVIDSLENQEVKNLEVFKEKVASVSKDKDVLLHTCEGYAILKGE